MFVTKFDQALNTVAYILWLAWGRVFRYSIGHAALQWCFTETQADLMKWFGNCLAMSYCATHVTPLTNESYQVNTIIHSRTTASNMKY